MVDQDVAAYLAGDSSAPVTTVERVRLDAIRSVLADAAVWAQPDPGLEARIVAATSGGGSSAAAHGGPKRSISHLLLGVAAALIIAAGVTFGLTQHRSTTATYAADLAGTPLAVDASGRATLTQTVSGWLIELRGAGLPRRDGGNFYEAWLKSATGVLVPIGTFNEPTQVTLWAGVSPAEFPTLTVTQQQADGNPASSGRVVLKGTVQPYPSVR